jgi:hypothetical protein
MAELKDTAYVIVEDEGLPGPEFDIPYGDWLSARPEEGEQRRAWEGVYERYRDARREVCGLDLEAEA